MADRKARLRRRSTIMLVLTWVLVDSSQAGGRLRATGGVSPIEGGAGGGLSPWAVLAGYGTRDEWGGALFATRLQTRDYGFQAHGAAVTARNRLELSWAEQDLRLDTLGPVLGLADPHLRMRVLGAKLRLRGDLIYGRGPQLSVGVQHKQLRDFAVPRAVGARADRGHDLYFSATRLLLGGAAGYNLLLSGTLRSTRANQGGLLGFGGDRDGGRSWQPELAIALLPRRDLALGLEWRGKPDSLGFAREDDWRDAFVAWFPHKQVGVTLAWVDLGSIAGLDRQRGTYLSLQLSW